MILTTCPACAAPLAHDAPRCIRCHTRYCNKTCQHDHWRRGHKQMCKKIHRGGNAEQYHADKKYKEAVAVAVEACADDTKGQTLALAVRGASHSRWSCVVEHLRKHDVVPESGEAVVETPHVSPTVVGRAVVFVVVVLGVGVCLVARRRRAAREASNSVQQLEALKELSLKLNPQSSNPEL